MIGSCKKNIGLVF